MDTIVFAIVSEANRLVAAESVKVSNEDDHVISGMKD